MSPAKTLLALCFYLLCFSCTYGGANGGSSTTGNKTTSTFRFKFPCFSLRNITFLGDSYLRDGVIGLTGDVTVPSSSSGTLVYNTPLHFFDQESNTTASFSTRFTFSIINLNPTSFGDGIAFFLSPDGQILGSPGGYLGLVNSSQLTKNRFLAVEFDARLDSHFNDPNENHVGFDIESLDSIKTSVLESHGINLKSGN